MHVSAPGTCIGALPVADHPKTSLPSHPSLCKTSRKKAYSPKSAIVTPDTPETRSRFVGAEGGCGASRVAVDVRGNHGLVIFALSDSAVCS